MLVGSREKVDFVSRSSLVSCDRIGCYGRVGVAYVRHVVYIVDGRCYVELLFHNFSFPDEEYPGFGLIKHKRQVFQLFSAKYDPCLSGIIRIRGGFCLIRQIQGVCGCFETFIQRQ